MIYIACCSNEKLAPIFGVVMTSVGVNVKSDDVMMYLLHNGLKDKTIKRLHEIANRFHISFELMEINTSLLKYCPTDKKIHYADIMMYARLLLPSMLPNLDKIIYLDCDLVVNRDLKDLWDFDVNGVAVAMAPDHYYKNKPTFERLGMTNCVYLNSGVIVMNLEYWRKYDVQRRILNFIEEKGVELVYFDQDALNVILQTERKQLPIKYNCTPFHFQKKMENFPIEFEKEIAEARENPIIFHFMGKAKPWFLGSYVPGKKLFKQYQRLSGWKHQVIKKQLLKRILYTLIPKMKKNSWENKTYIEGWESFYFKNRIIL